MSIIRPFFEGIGTGAGVAWPIFGIVTSTLSLGSGGTTAVALGAFCSSLFLIVSVPIFYFSYQNYKNEENKLNNKFITRCNELYFNINQTVKNLNLSANPSAQKNTPISLCDFGIEQEKYHDFKAYLTILIMQNNYEQLLENEKNTVVANIVNHLVTTATMKCQNSITSSTLIYSAFLGFVGAFGTIAGCSAGFMGLLAGLGIVSGFSAAPVLGIMILILAVGCGIYSAFTSVDSIQEKISKKAVCKQINAFNSFLMTYQNLKENEGVKSPHMEMENTSVSWTSTPRISTYKLSEENKIGFFHGDNTTSEIEPSNYGLTLNSSN
ncbi:hypothetical protein [Legionella hackeliae]|uniref:Uncharacterized protein n=1 Tax=Legionella hackeliae TaxID=449 RepID=A0A0A8URE4_LEGHA|nr:hypothetical protein [Legionella hackeliae]KTD10568.1 hypothetical protein Lhac_2936 [Legionella hackeliae]CEK10071.1 membrane protein of unknown function [Legionella hackeliae]STX46797.1 Uncharacterised protein [Legionella hackeliae]